VLEPHAGTPPSAATHVYVALPPGNDGSTTEQYCVDASQLRSPQLNVADPVVCVAHATSRPSTTSTRMAVL
jgi:hypothetical protein